MLKLLATFLCGAALFLSSVAIHQSPADARRGFHGGGHAMGHARAGRAYRGGSVRVNRNVTARRNANRNVNVNRTVNRRYVYRNGQRGYWRNGVWIVAPAVAGAGYVASCAYEYSRWQSTGSSYWRDRYYGCVN